MNRLTLERHLRTVDNDVVCKDAAQAYDQAAEGYIAYADGDPRQLFSFGGHHGYADRYVWSVLDTKLRELRRSGATSVTILDAGCGPGTWTRRLVTRAKLLGFTRIIARGFDVAQAQINSARRNARDLMRTPGVGLTFEVADLEDAMREKDTSVDIAICLYSVLSHLPLTRLPRVAREFARITRGSFITTVRAIGSTPTAFVDSIDAAQSFQLDHGLDRCDVEFRDGRRLALRFHLFAADELQSQFADYFEIEDLCGIDLFHERFSPDPRWNPAAYGLDARLSNLLTELEDKYARNPTVMNRATHLMLIGRHRRN